MEINDDNEVLDVISSDAETQVVSVPPRIRAPIRPPPPLELLTRAITIPRISLSDSLGNYGNFQTQSIANYEFVRNSILIPWMGSANRSEILTRHVLYVPDQIEWADTVPTRRYLRLWPKAEHNAVTCITAFENYLLVGLDHGQVISYNLNLQTILRTYRVKENCPITQIITGKKANKFFVITVNEFHEFSYIDETLRFKYLFPYVIRKALILDSPLLLVDASGSLYECSFRYDSDLTSIVKVSEISMAEVSYIQDLKSFDPRIFERTRPCMVRKKCCLAIVDISLNAAQKLTLWRKELISVNPNDRIIICTYYDKYFYAIIPSLINPTSNYIYISPLKNMNSGLSLKFIKPSTGILTNMKCVSHFLMVFTQNWHLEVFDAQTLIKKFHLSLDQEINDLFMIKNVLLMGTKEGSIIVEEMNMIQSQVCDLCKPNFHFEPITVLQKCFHNLPHEQIVQPYFH